MRQDFLRDDAHEEASVAQTLKQQLAKAEESVQAGTTLVTEKATQEAFQFKSKEAALEAEVAHAQKVVRKEVPGNPGGATSSVSSRRSTQLTFGSHWGCSILLGALIGRKRSLMTARASSTEGVINTHALPPAVHWGSATKEALPVALKKLNCQRAFLMVSRTLRSQSNALEEIQSALGETCVGIWDGMPAHTPRNAVLEAAKEAKKVNADVIVTIGGGSLTDGAKVVRIALETGATHGDELGKYCFKGDISAVKETKLIPQVSQG
eukprot:symbB.v1.2.019435.t1/scaffold1590.1/size110306/1